jgi:hypothetical protein
MEAEEKEALAGAAAPNWVYRSRKARDFYYELAQKIKTVAVDVLDRAGAEPTSVADEEEQTGEPIKEISMGMKVSDWVSFVRLGYTLEKAALDGISSGVSAVARKKKAAGSTGAGDGDELQMQDIANMSAAEMKEMMGRLNGGKPGTITKQ